MFYCRVVDTPGLGDRNLPEEVIASTLSEIVRLCPGGVHVFLYIHNATDRRFTKEQDSAMQQLKVRLSDKQFDMCYSQKVLLNISNPIIGEEWSVLIEYN